MRGSGRARTTDLEPPGGGGGGSALRILGTASCNQSHCKFGRFAGIQCVSNCVLYLVKSFLAGRPLTSRPELDDVLDEGARLDALMRQSGILRGHEMAQLTDVPSSVTLRAGGRVNIYRSAEIFGLVLFPAQISNSAVVQSLAEVLHGGYNGVAQFILYICDIYAGAIIIETDGSFYLFDPHCQKDAAPGTPAHVRVSTYAHDILQYVGAPGAQYTCVHLYFLPEAFEMEDPRVFMLEHYGVYDFYEANGSGFDLVGPELVSSDGEQMASPAPDRSPPVMLPFQRQIIPYNLRPLPSRSLSSETRPARMPETSPSAPVGAQTAPGPPVGASEAPADAASSPPLFIPIPGLGPGPEPPSTPPRGTGGLAPQTPKRKKGPGKDSPHKKPTSGRRLPMSSTTDTEDDQPPPRRPPSVLTRLPAPVVTVPQPQPAVPTQPASVPPSAAPPPHPSPVIPIPHSPTPKPPPDPTTSQLPTPQPPPISTPLVPPISTPLVPRTPTPQPPQAATPTPQPPQAATPTPQPPQAATPTPQPPQAATPTPQPPQAATPTPQPPQAATPTPQPPQATSHAPQLPRAASPAPQPTPTATATPQPPPVETSEPEQIPSSTSPLPSVQRQSSGEDASVGSGLVRYLSDVEEPFLSMSESEEDMDFASDIPTSEEEEDDVFSNGRIRTSRRRTMANASHPPPAWTPPGAATIKPPLTWPRPRWTLARSSATFKRLPDTRTPTGPSSMTRPLTGKCRRDALSTIDHLLVTVVLEQGLIRSRSRSAALNLLEFLKDWSGNLQVPTRDLERLLTSELNVQNLAAMLSENKGRASEFHMHLAAKLAACLPSLAAEDASRVDAAAGLLAKIPRLAEAADGKFDLDKARRRLTDLLRPLAPTKDESPSRKNGWKRKGLTTHPPGLPEPAASANAPLVLDDERWRRLMSLAEVAGPRGRTSGAAVDEEDVRFLALLTAIEYGAPSASVVPPFVHNVAAGPKPRALHVRKYTADVRDRVASAASDYLSYLEDPSLPTVMDFDDLLTRLRHTCQIIASLSDLNIRHASIERDYRELLYLGTALGDMTGIPWPLERVEEDDAAIAPLPEFETVAEKQKELEATKENEKRLRVILEDIEAMLGLAGVASAPRGAPGSPADPDATPPLADTAALTIPVMEKYIANAGSIVGAAKNPTYIRLRDTIQQIVRSKKYLMNILKSITFYTVDNYISSFEESIDHLYRGLPALDPEVQEGIDRILDPMVSEALHTFETGNRLTLEPVRLVALQNFATHSTLRETAAAVNLLPGLLAVYDATVSGRAPENALRLLAGLQNQLSQTLIPGKLKKRFLSYLQKLKNDNNDQLRQKEAQAWRLEADGFAPASEEQLKAFLDTAPNKELKRQYEKKLRRLLEAGRKEKELLREREARERTERRAREAGEAWARIQKALGTRPEPAPTAPDDWNTLLASLTPEAPDDSKVEAATAKADAAARNAEVLETLTRILAAMLSEITRVKRERLRALLGDGGGVERMEAAEPGWFAELEAGPLARLDAWPTTASTSDGGGRGAEEAGALFRARTAAGALRAALTQARQALQSPDAKSATVNTDLEAPYEGYERGLAELQEKRRAAEAALSAAVSEYVDRTLPGALDDPSRPAVPPPPSLPPPATSDPTLWPKKSQLLTKRERDDLLQATGDFFSELLTEAEAAQVRALEERVLESRALAARAHETAVGARRGFQTALEAVLARAREEAPDDELRALLPTSSTPKSSIHETLAAALGRAAARDGSWPYRRSLAAAEWIRDVCGAVRGLAEGALALAGGPATWLELAAAAEDQIGELKRLLELESMAQNSMDGMEELRLALATVDPRRVAGGKETVADWKRRLARLEAIIQEAREESRLQDVLQDLVTRARGHVDPRQLKIVAEAARGLALGAAAGSPQYALLRDRLVRYASAKQSFLAFYETAQPTVFVRRPLTDTGDRPLLAPRAPASPTGPLPVRRAQFLAAAGPAKYAGTLWLETESPCDPLNPAYVSSDTQEPLNYIPVYHNFLEYVMPTVLENPEAFALAPAGQPSARGREARTLASVASARLGAAAADSYWDSWSDVEANAGELLREYVSAPKALMEDLADNPIVAMTLLAHATLIASRNHPPFPTPATDREVILLEQREIMTLLVGTHPAYAAAFLGAPSFYAGLGLVSALARDGGLGELLSDAVLTYRLVRSPAERKRGSSSTAATGAQNVGDAHRRFTGPPSGFIFLQEAWEEIETRAALWPHPEFLGLVHNQSTARARACLLLLARRCFAPEALQQLWHSLRPLEGPVAFQDYVRDFVRRAYTRGEELPRAESVEVPRETPSTYGTVTGRALRNLMPYGTPITGPKRGSGDAIPVSVFEAAVAAAFLGRPLTLFVSSQYLFNVKTLGQVRVVAPLLYCDGRSEPFRSLAETVSLDFMKDLEGYSESFEPEMSVFARQAAWLRELLAEARAAKPKEAQAPTVAVLANRKNIVWKCFTYRHNLPDLQFHFNPAGASRWPTDVLNPSFYEHEDPPPVGYRPPPNPRNVQELFSGFPPRVGHGLVSGDGFQSADNTPASVRFQSPGGETEEDEEGSAAADSEASVPPSPQSPRLPAVTGRAGEWPAPSLSPRGTSAAPREPAPASLPHSRGTVGPHRAGEKGPATAVESPGASPRPWPREVQEIVPAPAAQGTIASPGASQRGPAIYNLHPPPSPAAAGPQKHTIQIPGLGSPPAGPRQPQPPAATASGRPAGATATAATPASSSVLGPRRPGLGDASPAPPHGHSIMQRERQRPGGQEEHAKVQSTAAPHRPPPVSLKPRTPGVASTAQATLPAWDSTGGYGTGARPREPLEEGAVPGPTRPPGGGLAPRPHQPPVQKPPAATAPAPTTGLAVVGGHTPGPAGAMDTAARPEETVTKAPPPAAVQPRVPLPVKSKQQQTPAFPLTPMHPGSAPSARPEVEPPQSRHAGAPTYIAKKAGPSAAPSPPRKSQKYEDSIYYPPSGSIHYPAPFQTLSFSRDKASPTPSSDQPELLWNTPSVVTQFLSIEDIIREVVSGGSTPGDLVVPSAAHSSLSAATPDQDMRYSLTLAQARRVLTRFVTQLRHKLERSTHRLITDLERLKFLYL
ncbi:BPLF1 [Macacine gammaherpesvirus 4]|uniref:BPLF1 n=1 Tax=Macacine gammaherpesvirus 4 TaxID=45455 RepID=Q8UZI9_9GAMA|nr:BPLF1 [Macacine gammaherpesvirus 4]AAK95420.1 BPLF1 [Macacine gammaherpesvirus 4]